MNEKILKILDQFALDAAVVSAERYGGGHINETYLVVTASGRRYILQRINQYVFKNVEGLMGNIAAVTEYLREIVTDPRGVMTLVKTTAGKDYLTHGRQFLACV